MINSFIRKFIAFSACNEAYIYYLWGQGEPKLPSVKRQRISIRIHEQQVSDTLTT
ncbi:hypothetical protein CE91St46_30090 [Eubacteriales bacterium]|nr:hypothetical protein CE91St46_30090 [Eubacteriales bacterium]GKH64618.1 hypothetical protein CE91St47_30870 [Eubacteriales bacterium]